MQDHWDDCGNDLSGIGITTYHTKDIHYKLPGDEEPEAEPEAEHSGVLTQWHMYLGSEVECETINDLELPTTIRKVASVGELFHLLTNSTPGDDVVEFCGGTARTTVILVHRRFKSGGNWDLCTGFDINCPETQRLLNNTSRYVEPRLQ